MLNYEDIRPQYIYYPALLEKPSCIKKAPCKEIPHSEITKPIIIQLVRAMTTKLTEQPNAKGLLQSFTAWKPPEVTLQRSLARGSTKKA